MMHENVIRSTHNAMLNNRRDHLQTLTNTNAWRLELDTPSEKPLYQQIVWSIRDQIVAGRLIRGQRLPAMRQISSDLGIAYATVARAMRELVQEGVLESSTGGGTRVAYRRRNRLETIGIAGSQPYKRLVDSSRYSRRLLTLLMDNIVEHRRTVVYDHWAADTQIGSMFNELSLVDGLLLLGADADRLEQFHRVRRMGAPIVCLGETFDADVPTVDSANLCDTIRGVEALCSMGHQRIAFLLPPGYRTSGPMRREGYRRAMAQSPGGYQPKFVLSDHVDQMVKQLLALSPRPTAAFLAGGVAQFSYFFDALKGTPLEPGKGLYICAYDENLWKTIAPLGIEYMRLDQPLEQIARQGTQSVVKMLDDHAFNPGHVEIPARLVRVDAKGQTQTV